MLPHIIEKNLTFGMGPYSVPVLFRIDDIIRERGTCTLWSE